MQKNKGKVYISGGGKASETHVIDEHFVKSLKNKRILYIPIGLKRTITGYEECYDWINGFLQKYTDTPLTIDMWINLKKLNYEYLVGFDAVYIGGAGNTYRLMDLLEEFKTSELLIKYLIEGGTIYGGSSGGVVLGRNINTSWDLGADRNGLGFILNYSIWCHINLCNYNPAQDTERRDILPLIALPENSGILFIENKITVLGLSDIKIITEGGVSLYKPGDSVTI